MLDQSSFDLMISQSQYQALKERLELQDMQLRRLNDVVKEKQQIIIQVVDQLNKSKEIVKKLSYNTLKISRKFMQNQQQKLKLIHSLKEQLSIKDAKLKQFYEISNIQRQDLQQIKSKFYQAESSLKRIQQQKQKQIKQMTLQHLRLQDNLNKLKRSERFRINQQKQQLADIVTLFLNKMKKESDNLSQEIISSDKITKQISTQIQFIQNITQEKSLIFQELFSNQIINDALGQMKKRNSEMQQKFKFLKGKIEAILVQIQQLMEKL